MKITIVRRRCGLNLGGAEGYCANVAFRFKERGHDVRIVADESSVNGVSFVRARVAGRGSILKNLSFFMESQLALNRLAPSCVYGLSRVRGADFLRISDPLHAAWLELGYRDNLILAILRRFSLRHSLLLWQERQAIRSCGYLITNSRLVKRQLKHYYNVRPEYVFVVYTGVDHDRFRPCSKRQIQRIRRALEIGQQDVVILFAGLDYRRKGLTCLLEAVSKLGKSVKIIVAGIDKTKELELLGSKLGILDRIRWIGFRHDMERVYAAADIFCLPTSYDPFANSVLEAMACGTPVVTTRLNGAAEAVGPVDESLLIDRPDPGKLANALRYFLDLAPGEKEGLREAMVEHSRNFSWDSHVEHLEGLFQKHYKRP